MVAENEEKKKLVIVGGNNFLVPCLLMIMLGYFLVSRHGNALTTVDLAFPIGYLAYIYIANIVCFDSNKLLLSQRITKNIPLDPMGKDSLGRGQFITESSFMIYFGVSKIISLLIPLVMIFAGPSDIAVMVTPSLLIVIAQFVGEQSTGTFHDVLRILVPIGFVSYRLFGPDTTWARDSWSLWLQKEQAGEFSSSNYDYYWYTFNLLLSCANFAFAAWNLFGFLLLRVLPLYFDKEETPRVEMAYTLLPLPKKNKNENKKNM